LNYRRAMAEAPDLDSHQHIDQFIKLFYDKLLNDEIMAPVFLEDAKIDIRTHLPTISLYWQKMLLGDDQYRTHMMNKHRVVHKTNPFKEAHFIRWLTLFEEAIAANNSGPYTEKARKIAKNVIRNMKTQLL